MLALYAIVENATCNMQTSWKPYISLFVYKSETMYILSYLSPVPPTLFSGTYYLSFNSVSCFSLLLLLITPWLQSVLAISARFYGHPLIMGNLQAPTFQKKTHPLFFSSSYELSVLPCQRVELWALLLLGWNSDWLDLMWVLFRQLNVSWCLH